MAVPQDLLDILACPKCKQPVVLAEEQLVCNNRECRLAYEIRDDIPIMLIEEAQELPLDKWENIMASRPPKDKPKPAAAESEKDEG